MDIIKFVNELSEQKTHPKFKAGDTLTVHYKIIEGTKERVQKRLRICNYNLNS